MTRPTTTRPTFADGFRGDALREATEGSGRAHVPRPEQERMAVALDRLMDANAEGASPALAAIQAETGVGKTLAGLAALCVHAARGTRGFFASPTVDLQRQAVRGDAVVAADFAERVTGRRPTVAIQVGRRQVVSRRRFRALVNDLVARHRGSDGARTMEALLEWVEGRTGFVLVHEVMERLRELTPDRPFDLPFGVVVDQFCVQPGRSVSTDPDYMAMRAEAAAADVVVLNHHLLAVDVLTGPQGADFTGRKSGARPNLVVDEAHVLADTVADIASVHVRASELMAAAEAGTSDVDAPERDAARALNAMLVDLHDDLEAREVRRSRPEGSREADAVYVSSLTRDTRARLVEAFGAAVDAVRSVADPEDDDLTVTLEQADVVLQRVRALQDGEPRGRPPFVYWTPTKGYPGLAYARPEASLAVSSLIGDTVGCGTVTLMSGTMTNRAGDGGFDTVLWRLGMSRGRVADGALLSIAPSSFGVMDFVRVPHATPAPTLLVEGSDETITDPEALAAWADLVETAYGRGDGRALVLCTSYRDVGLLAALLRERDYVDPDDLVVQEPGAKMDRYRHAFTGNPSSVWISPSAWTGVDLPGLVRHLVMTRIPFAPPSLFDTNDRGYYLGKGLTDGAIDSKFFQRSLFDAVAKTAQGMGRGIRRPEDRVTVWLGDSRLPITPAMRRRMLAEKAPWNRVFEHAVPERFRDAYRNAAVMEGPEGERAAA